MVHPHCLVSASPGDRLSSGVPLFPAPSLLILRHINHLRLSNPLPAVPGGTRPWRSRPTGPHVLLIRTGARERATALARLTPQPGGLPLLAVATGPSAGEGFDCPPLDTPFLAAPVASKGRLLHYSGRILRPYEGKATAEVHDEPTGVLASSLAKRAPGYTGLGFPDPRKLPTPPARARPAQHNHKDQQQEAERGSEAFSW
jgi:hypothetical protein